MTGQPTLFDTPAEAPRSTAPYQAHSETSEAAARRLKPTLNAKQLSVFREIVRRRSVTDNALVRHFMAEPWRWSINTPRARRVELTEAGFVRDSGRKEGASALWTPTEAGEQWLKEQDR